MDSEFSTLIDDLSIRRTALRQAVHARGQHESDTAAASGASVGEEQIEEQLRRDAAQRVLIALEAAFYDDYGTRLDAASRAGFECFTRYNPKVVPPLVGAESTGQLVATWMSGDECLSLRFIDRYRLHYALTVATPDGLSRDWGAAHALTFLADHPAAERLATN